MLCRGQLLSFFDMEPEYSKYLYVFRDTSPIILTTDVSNAFSAEVAEAKQKLMSPLVVFESGAGKPTLVNDLYIQITSTVLKIKYKSY